MILSLGVCPCGGTDLLAWEHTKNGVFTVRSAHHLAMEKMEAVEASSSDNQLTRDL